MEKYGNTFLQYKIANEDQNYINREGLESITRFASKKISFLHICIVDLT